MTSVVSAFKKLKKSTFYTSKRSPTSHAKDVLRNWWLNLSRICILILRMFIDNLINGLFPFIVYLELVLQNTEKACCSETWLRDQNESTRGLHNPTPRSSRNVGLGWFTRTHLHTCSYVRTCVCRASLALLVTKKKKKKKSVCFAWILSTMIINVRSVLMCDVEFGKAHFTVW